MFGALRSGILNRVASTVGRVSGRPSGLAGLVSREGVKAKSSYVGGFAAGFVSMGLAVSAGGDGLHPYAYDWPHKGFFDSFDAASIRRGHQVYANVCATCHSIERIAYRNLVNVCYTEEEMKAEIEDLEVEDAVDDAGEIVSRPAKLSDYFPKVYKNEQEARAANNGALPPDLSLIVKARHGGADYIYALLTGYRDPPAGIELRDGLYYNPHFPGGSIGMKPPLQDEAVDYEDGTEPTVSQLAKDVVTFLAWAAEPEADDRKRMGVKTMALLGLAAVFTGYLSRARFTVLKSRSMKWVTPSSYGVK